MRFQHGRGRFLSCKEHHVFTETVAGGGLRLQALLLAILIIIPISLTSTPKAQAADNGLDMPTCAGTWKDGQFPMDNGARLSDVLNFQGQTLVCGDLYKIVDSRSGQTLVARKVDDGWRSWIESSNKYTITALEAGSWSEGFMLGDKYGGTSYSSDDSVHSPAGLSAHFAIIDGATLDNQYGYITPEKTITVIQLTYLATRNDDNTHAYPVLYSNGGTFADDTVVQTPWLTKKGALPSWTASNTPTRAGYTFKEWSTDQAGQHPVDPTTITLKNGTRLYAQWERAAGDPQKVDLDCSTGGRCELTVNYAGSTAKTREFQPGSGALAWSGSPVTGVRLDASGYAADGACSDTRCWYVSLDKEPNQQGAYQAQMPTTGAPEGLSSVGLVALIVIVLGVALTVLRRRS